VGRGVRPAAPRARELWDSGVPYLATFLAADGQQVRLVRGARNVSLQIYDPEAGSLLHRLQHKDCYSSYSTEPACIESSSVAPHHPRLVVGDPMGSGAVVWDGETGKLLTELEGGGGGVGSVAVWKEHTGGHDRIATSAYLAIRVWDGETFTLLHTLDCRNTGAALSAFPSAEGTHRLLVAVQ
jgi:WD40 repeat protein